MSERAPLSRAQLDRVVELAETLRVKLRDAARFIRSQDETAYRRVRQEIDALNAELFELLPPASQALS